MDEAVEGAQPLEVVVHLPSHELVVQDAGAGLLDLDDADRPPALGHDPHVRRVAKHAQLGRKVERDVQACARANVTQHKLGPKLHGRFG